MLEGVLFGIVLLLLLLGMVAWVHEGLVRLRSHRASYARDHRGGS